MKVKDLKPSAYNPRKISEKKLDMLGKAMRDFGDLSGIVFNLRTGKLIGGHQRVKHLKPEWEIVKNPCQDEVGTVAQGFVKTPFGDWVYREVDWDEKKEKAANIAANRSGGEWDYPLLKDLIVEIDTGELDLDLIGFEQAELEKIFTHIPLDTPKGGNDNGGKKGEDELKDGDSFASSPFTVPIYLALSRTQFEAWKEKKKDLGEKDDLVAFLLVAGISC